MALPWVLRQGIKVLDVMEVRNSKEGEKRERGRKAAGVAGTLLLFAPGARFFLGFVANSSTSQPLGSSRPMPRLQLKDSEEFFETNLKAGGVLDVRER